MSRRSRGNDFQDWCKKWLEKQYPAMAVHNQKSVATLIKIPGKGEVWVSKRNDIFGCVDLVAVSYGTKTMFIQCTLDVSIGRKFKELKEIPWNLFHEDVMVFQKKGPRRVVVFDMDCTSREFVKSFEIIGGKVKAKEGS